MRTFRADLHIHTLLSPCGSLEMSPDVIIERAKACNLDLIGITDHNSTRQCSVVKTLGQEAGITVLCGAEVTSKEEVHVLAFFETDWQLSQFQQYLDLHLPKITNDPKRFGYQVCVDRNQDITYTEEHLLISALDQGIEQIGHMVHQLQGLFIPAHIDRMRFGILNQLGFIPSGLGADAMELSSACRLDEFLPHHQELRNSTLICGSDAHYPDQIGSAFTLLEMGSTGFDEILRTLSRPESVLPITIQERPKYITN